MATKNRPMKSSGSSNPAPATREADYRHPEAETLLRPEVGTQAQFRKRKPPVTYRYDSSLAPALDWDEHPARELADAAIKEILDSTRRSSTPPERWTMRRKQHAIRSPRPRRQPTR
jgi:hypothetical protein